MPEAARVGDLTDHSVPLQGAGSPDVMIGNMKAWRAMPAGAGDGLDEASKDTKAIMDVKPTPAEAFAPPVVLPKAEKIKATMLKVAAQVEAASKMPGATAGVTAAFSTLSATAATLSAAYFAAAPLPGGEPPARVAFTIGYQMALASAMGAAVSAMAGPWDTHTCAMATPAPHGPGMVIKGCETVFINNLPAVMKTHQIMEAAGGPSTVQMGCPTVEIGDTPPSAAGAAKKDEKGMEGAVSGGKPPQAKAPSPPAAPPAAPAPASAGTTPPKAKTHTPGHLGCGAKATAKSPADRARTTVGIGETVELTAFNPTGKITWSASGSSKLSATTGSKVTFTAHERSESCTVTVADSCGCKVIKTFQVVEPSGVTMQRAPGTGIYHFNGIASVGIRTQIFITPDTVSFQNVMISEDDCTSVVTGYFKGTPFDGIHHAGHGAGNWVQLGSHVAGKGTKVNGMDTAQSGKLPPPYAPGTFDWPIPWLFRVGGGASKQFATVHQQFTIDAAGNMTVSKTGAHGATQIGDPTSTY